MPATRRKYLVLALIIMLSVSLRAQKGAGGGGGGGASGSGGGGKGSGGSNQAQGSGQGGGNVYFESQMLAYGAADQLAEAVAKEVCGKITATSTVIVYDPTSFQSLQMWETFSAAADLLTTSYKTLLTKDQLKAFQAEELAKPKFGAAFISSASDAAALLGAIAASTTENPSAFTISDSSMAVALAHQFLRTGSPPRCPNLASVKYFPLFGAFVDSTSRDAAKKKVSDAIDGPNQVRRFIQTTPSMFSSKDDPKYLEFAELNSLYDQLMATFISPNQSSANQNAGNQSGGSQQNSPTPPSGLMSLILGAELQALVDGKNTYILYADVVAAGGTQRDKKNLITVVLTGDWISYSGGLVVNIALTNSSTGQLLLADTVRYRADFTRIHKPGHSQTVEDTNAGENESSLSNNEKSGHPNSPPE